MGLTAGPSLIGCDESMVQLTLLRRCQNVLPAIGREVAAAPIDDEPVAAPLVGPALCLWSLPMWPDYRCPCARAPAYTAITGGAPGTPFSGPAPWRHPGGDVALVALGHPRERRDPVQHVVGRRLPPHVSAPSTPR